MYDPAWIALGLQLGPSMCVNPVGYSLADCDKEQMDHINVFADEMRRSLTEHISTSPYRRGAWIPSCPGHIFTLLSPFNSEDF